MSLTDVIQEYKKLLRPLLIGLGVIVCLYFLVVVFTNLELSLEGFFGTTLFYCGLVFILLIIGIVGDYYIVNKFNRLQRESYVLAGLLYNGMKVRESFSKMSGLERGIVGIYEEFPFYLVLGYDRDRGILFPIITLSVIIIINKPKREGLIYSKAELNLIKNAKDTYGITISLADDSIWCDDPVKIRGDKRDEKLLQVMDSLVNVARENNYEPATLDEENEIA